MQYLCELSNIPFPDVYHYDANLYSRLGNKYIFMPKVCTTASELLTNTHPQ